MNLNVIGGFLGSGKTTAIINALKTLPSESRRVGVTTNDKGYCQADAAFMRIETEDLRALIATALRAALTDAGISNQSTGATAYAPQVPDNA